VERARVIVTAHQAFFTEEALRGINGTTLQNLYGVRRRKAKRQ
jgi:lactate dehydrogenase-like 2-hydroxyacid dehydrogenase